MAGGETAPAMSAPASRGWDVSRRSVGALAVVGLGGPIITGLVALLPIGLIAGVELAKTGGCCDLISKWATREQGLSAAGVLGDAWITLAAASAGSLVLRGSFQLFPNIPPRQIIGVYFLGCFCLTYAVSFDLIRFVLGIGWGGVTAACIFHFMKFGSIAILRPPPAAAREAGATPGGLGPLSPAVFSAKLSRRAVRSNVAYAMQAMFTVLLLAYAVAEASTTLFLLGLFVFLWDCLAIFETLTAGWAKGPRLVIDAEGIVDGGARLAWDEVGRIWSGPGAHESLLLVETSAEAERRMWKASPLLVRLFAFADVSFKEEVIGTNSWEVSAAVLDATSSDIARAIEARRPRDARSTLAPDVAERSFAADPSTP